MEEVLTVAARAAAGRLAGQYGAMVEVEVETALRDTRSPEQFLDPVAVGTLIVTAAGVAWGIFKDVKRRGEAIKSDQIVKQVRVRVMLPKGVSSAQGDQIVEVVLDEVIAAADKSDPPLPPG
jgi:hypothetical protein